jgi:hypothetical protein
MMIYDVLLSDVLGYFSIIDDSSFLLLLVVLILSKSLIECQIEALDLRLYLKRISLIKFSFKTAFRQGLEHYFCY